MNKLYDGFLTSVDLPEGGFLYIGDEVPSVPCARIFDHRENSFNLLNGLDYKGARVLASLFYVPYPQGENTLTVRNGKWAMLEALWPEDKPAHGWGKKKAPKKRKPRRLDQMEGDEEVNGILKDVLTSPVLRRVLCNPTVFHSIRIPTSWPE